MRLTRRVRLPRPSTRQLGATVAALGLFAALAFLLVPVQTAFGDDPLLRLGAFSPALGQAATAVDCGVPVANLGRRAGDLSLYGLARDGACRDAAFRRAATAVAAGSLIGVLGLITLTGAPARAREAVA